MEQKPEIAPRIRRVHARKSKERRKYGKSTYATGVLRVVALLRGSFTEFCLCTAKADYRSGSKMKFAFPHRSKDAEFRAFSSYHTLADDDAAQGPPHVISWWGWLQTMTKREVLSIFDRAGGFLTPDQTRMQLHPSPDRRSVYSYLLRLSRQGLLERKEAGRGRLTYRLTDRGAAAPGVSATGSIASTFAGVAVSTSTC